MKNAQSFEELESSYRYLCCGGQTGGSRVLVSNKTAVKDVNLIRWDVRCHWEMIRHTCDPICAQKVAFPLE